MRSKWFIATLMALTIQTGTNAQTSSKAFYRGADPDTTATLQKDINEGDHLAALIRTDRLPRNRKCLWLMPGRETHFYYEWVRKDGSTVTQILTTRLKHVPDRRDIRDSHPNLSIVMPAVVNGGMNALGGAIGNKL